MSNPVNTRNDIEFQHYNNNNNEEYIRLYSLSRTVKWLAIIDGFFSFFYLLVTPYLGLYSLFSLIIAISGYHGAKNLKKNNTLIYLIFFSLKTLLNIVIPIYIFCNYNASTNWILFNIFIMLLEVYLTSIIYKFYFTLKKYTEQELDNIRLMTEPVRVIIW